MADKPPPPPPPPPPLPLPPPPSLGNTSHLWLQLYPRLDSTPAETSTTSRYYQELYSHVRNAPSAPTDQQPWERNVPAGESKEGDEVDCRELNVARRDETRVDHRKSVARRDNKVTQTGKRAKKATGADKRLVSRRKKAGVYEKDKDEREIKIFGKSLKLASTDQEAKEKSGVDVIVVELASSDQIAQEKAGADQRVLDVIVVELASSDQIAQEKAGADQRVLDVIFEELVSSDEIAEEKAEADQRVLDLVLINLIAEEKAGADERVLDVIFEELAPSDQIAQEKAEADQRELDVKAKEVVQTDKKTT